MKSRSWRSTWTDALAAALLVVGAVLFAPTGRAQDDMLAGAAVTDTAEVTPLTIFGSKVVAWYRPDDGYVSGSPYVTQLDDRSGNAYHLNVSNGTPTLVTNSGDPAIDCEEDAGVDCLGLASAVDTDEPLAFYAVVQAETTGIQCVVAITRAATTVELFGLRLSGTTKTNAIVLANGAQSDAVHGTTVSTGVRYVMYADFTANNARSANLNGGTPVSETTSRTVGTVDYTTVGGRRNSGSFQEGWDGLIFEVVILNAAPTAGENTAYLAYTTSRFGTP